MSKFLSYVKKFLAMLSLSLVVSISLFNKGVFAIDPAKVIMNAHDPSGLTYMDLNHAKNSYKLSSDKKSFSVTVEDEGTVVYSQVTYVKYGTVIATLPVTSIYIANGVRNFTLNLVDLKNDKVKIIPSEDGEQSEVKLNYDGNLSLFERENFDCTDKKTIFAFGGDYKGRFSSLSVRLDTSLPSSTVSTSQSDDNYKVPQYLLDLTSSKDIYESVQKELEKELSAYLAEHPWVDLNIDTGPYTRQNYLKKILKQLSEEQRNAYNYEAGKILYEKIMKEVSEDYNKWLDEHSNATEARKEKRKNDLFMKRYNSLNFDDRDLIDDYLETLEKSSSTVSEVQKSKYYVDENGRTVADITEYGMVWLKETSDGTSAWYGIDNSNGTFKIGSKFWVKWLSPKIDREEFEEYYNKLDDEHKKKVDNNNLWIFLTGVTDPDGNEYTNFYGNLNYYIQIGDDWDKDDINVVFISDTKDAILDVSYATLECPEGKGEFAKVVMKHFSPYAVYDEKDETKASNVSKSASIKTGESVSKFIFMFWVLLLLVAFLNRKMDKNSICS